MEVLADAIPAMDLFGSSMKVYLDRILDECAVQYSEYFFFSFWETFWQTSDGDVSTDGGSDGSMPWIQRRFATMYA